MDVVRACVRWRERWRFRKIHEAGDDSKLGCEASQVAGFRGIRKELADSEDDDVLYFGHFDAPGRSTPAELAPFIDYTAMQLPKLPEMFSVAADWTRSVPRQPIFQTWAMSGAGRRRRRTRPP